DVRAGVAEPLGRLLQRDPVVEDMGEAGAAGFGGAARQRQERGPRRGPVDGRAVRAGCHDAILLPRVGGHCAGPRGPAVRAVMTAAPAAAAAALRALAERIRALPGVRGKAAIGAVAEVFGPTDFRAGPGDDGAVVED